MAVASHGKFPSVHHASLSLLLPDNLLWSLHFAPVGLEGLCNHPVITEKESKAPTDDQSKLGPSQKDGVKGKRRAALRFARVAGAWAGPTSPQGNVVWTEQPYVPIGSLFNEPVGPLVLCFLAKMFYKAGDLCMYQGGNHPIFTFTHQ